MNGKKPPEGVSLKPLIGAATDAAAVRPGIIAVGFQEIVPLSASNVIVGSALTNIRAWDRLIAMELNGEAWYAVLSSPVRCIDSRRFGG